MLSFAGVKDGSELTNLYKLCYLVYKRHYNMYTQYKEEMVENAIVEVYSSLSLYNSDYSLINYLYTVIRNSYTKDVNKYKRTFVREDSDFKNEISKDYSDYSLAINDSVIESICNKFPNNKRNVDIIKSVINSVNGVRPSKNKKKRVIIVGEEEEMKLSRIFTMILYEYREQGLV